MPGGSRHPESRKASNLNGGPMPSPTAQNRARKAAHRTAGPTPRSSGDGFQPQASFVVEFGALPSGRRATGIHHVEADRSARFDGYDVQNPAFWMLRRLPADAGGATPIAPAIDPDIASKREEAGRSPVKDAIVAPAMDADRTPDERSDGAPAGNADVAAVAAADHVMNLAPAPVGVPRDRFEFTDAALSIPAAGGAQPQPLDPNAWVFLNAAVPIAVSLRVGLATRPASSTAGMVSGDAPADNAEPTRPIVAMLRLAPVPDGDARTLRHTHALAPCGFAQISWAVGALAPGRYELTAIAFADDAWAVPTRRRLARVVVVN
jgi:hypothetical protein